MNIYNSSNFNKNNLIQGMSKELNIIKERFIQTNKQILLPFGQENIKLFSKQEILDILNNDYDSIEIFVKKIHLNSELCENRNILFNNINSLNGYVYDGKQWNIQKKSNILTLLIDNMIKYIQYFYKLYDLENTLEKTIKYIINSIINKQFDDDYISHIKDRITLTLYNERQI